MQHLALAVGNRLAVQKEGIASAQRRKHRSCSLLGVRGARDRVGHVDIGTDLAFFKWPNVQAISYVARIRPDEPFDLVEVLHAACIEELPQALAALGRRPLAHERRGDVLAHVFRLAQRQVVPRHPLEKRGLEQIDHRPIRNERIAKRLVLAHQVRDRPHLVYQAPGTIEADHPRSRRFPHAPLLTRSE